MTVSKLALASNNFHPEKYSGLKGAHLFNILPVCRSQLRQVQFNLKIIPPLLRKAGLF
jgi:hypothetical protein